MSDRERVDEPEFWVDEAVSGSGYVVGSTRLGRVVDRAATLEDAERICTALNAAAQSPNGSQDPSA